MMKPNIKKGHVTRLAIFLCLVFTITAIYPIISLVTTKEVIEKMFNALSISDRCFGELQISGR